MTLSWLKPCEKWSRAVRTLLLTQSHWALLLLPPKPRVFLLLQWTEDQSPHTAEEIAGHYFLIIYTVLLLKISPLNKEWHRIRGTCQFNQNNTRTLTRWSNRLRKISSLMFTSSPTFPFWTSSLASWTTLRTLEAIQRYLKNLWWADQNWPHMDFFMRCSASIRFAACWNFSRALTH